MDNFFVGYAPLTKVTRRRTLFVGIGLITLVVATGASIAKMQQAAGIGQWDPATQAHVQGLLLLNPYPVLHTVDGPVLLVRAGKHSAVEYVEAFHTSHVAIKGVPIERGGWRMLEVSKPTDVQAASPIDAINSPETKRLGEFTLQGEIVDSKCYLGVMKPGAGKVHRACAAMCLAGGMPPMLVVTEASGDKYGYLLTDENGLSASQALVEHVALPVKITGQLEERGDLTYLRIATDGVHRL